MGVNVKLDDSGAETRSPKKKGQKSLLQQLDVPIANLDFKFVENCKDSKEIEKILRILRSGEEGYYPEFQDFVQKRLEELNPKSRHLRVETPVIRSAHMGKNELTAIEDDLSAWLNQCEKPPNDDVNSHQKDLFTTADISGDHSSQHPIRGTITTKVDTKSKQESGSGDMENFLKPKNPNRIKSWEYDKWDKFDVDAELMKSEIDEMRQEEVKQQKPIMNTPCSTSSSRISQISSQPTPADNLTKEKECNVTKSHNPKELEKHNQTNLVKEPVSDSSGSKMTKQFLNDKTFSSSSFVAPPTASSKSQPVYSGALGRSFIEEISGDSDEESLPEIAKTNTTSITSKSGTKPESTSQKMKPSGNGATIQEILTKPKIEERVIKQRKRVNIFIDDLRIG